MLAVFEKSVAKSPEGLQSPESTNSVSALKDGFLGQHFASLYPSSVTLNLASSALLAYSLHKNNPLLPRYNIITLFLLFFSKFIYLCQNLFFIFFIWVCLKGSKFEPFCVGYIIYPKCCSYPFDPLNIW